MLEMRRAASIYHVLHLYHWLRIAHTFNLFSAT